MTIAPGQEADAGPVNAAIAARLLASANLADLPNKSMARNALGILGMALQNPASVAITGGSLDGVNIGATPPGFGAFGTLNMLGNLPAPAPGFVWSDDGARVQRINDRLLGGAAVVNDAAKPAVSIDWLTTLINWPVFNATAAITSAFGTIALTVGSQTVDLDPVAAGTTETTIGVAAFAIANNPGTFPDDYFAAYGYYAEARVYPGTVSNAFGAELEAINLSGTANGSPTPYRELFTGSAQALRLGSGGGQGLSPDPAISALAIIDNGSTFNAGIVFSKGSLTGADGTTGFGTALAMGKGHLLSWYAVGGGDGERTMFITSTVTDADYKVSIQAQDGGFLFIQPNDQTGFCVATAANVANSITVVPGASATAAAVQADGNGSNPNLAMRARSGGRFEWGCTTQANAAAGSGGALPANADLFMQVTVNGTGYVVPLLKASCPHANCPAQDRQGAPRRPARRHPGPGIHLCRHDLRHPEFHSGGKGCPPGRDRQGAARHPPGAAGG